MTSIRARAISTRLAAERAAARALEREASAERRRVDRERFDDDFLPTAAVARLLAVTPATLRRWRQCGRGPRFVRLGNTQQSRVRYPRVEVRRFIGDPGGYQPGATTEAQS